MLPSLLAFLLGLALFLVGLRQKRKLQACLNWPAANGIVTRTWLDQQESGDSENGYSTSYSPRMEYRYEAGGCTYTGQRIAVSEQSYPTPKRAQAALAPYPAGGPVMVFFNPQDPPDAVLVREAPGNGFLLWAGVATAVVAMASAVAK